MRKYLISILNVVLLYVLPRTFEMVGCEIEKYISAKKMKISFYNFTVFIHPAISNMAQRHAVLPE